MPTHVVIGAGPIGSGVARLLADSGDRVRVVTRGGGGPDHPSVERVAADATDAARLTELTTDATTLFNCAAPPYNRWPEEFPPLSDAAISAAERTGARYVLMGNLYGYGPVDGPLTEDLPLAPTSRKGQVRVRMWEDALAAHEAGWLRATEVRASDFLGRGAGSLYNLMITANILAGEPAAYPADLDAPHAWTHVGDAAATLVAAARTDEAFGRAWHAPSTSHASARELTARLAGLTGSPAPRLREMTDEEVAQAGLADPIVAELPEILYLDRRPLVVNAEAAERVLGVKPTPFDQALLEMAEGHRASA
ncbi:NAD-dependent epimerase/dehydratase family protein [Streptomyces sp. NBC_01803]|uniref:NAD-dependent epimerase/dehydratase family protein n=1 Tax=Streptomyces sp. NBC_01803 TaxID=2975946 RepID=UPI002DD7E0CC|nr:NAD-dependent epimerase/dehydratase family protein [Streptomyces sp. NBC_01803]WSA45892.1 NAD-dependent epimerase/dehydratase family protein [Streptomyces sp. NBC_01803]